MTAIDILKNGGLEISDKAIKNGLAAARWPARFEILSSDPLIIFDGAHNPEGIAAAVESIKHYFGDRKVYLLSGVLGDKDYRYIAAKVAEVASRAFTMTPDNPRALSAEKYAEILKENSVPATPYSDIRTAFTAAKAAAKEDGVPLVCLGSLYTYVDISKLNEEM